MGSWRPSGQASVPWKMVWGGPLAVRIWANMSAVPSSSCRPNQSQPTASELRALVPNSWSIQLTPVTGTTPRGRVRVPWVSSPTRL